MDSHATPRTSLQAFFGNVLDFYQHFYGEHGVAKKPTLERSALKMLSEAGEFADAIAKSESKERQEDEWADILFSLLHTSVVAGYDISSAMARVAAKNYKKFDPTVATVVDGVIVKCEDLPISDKRNPGNRAWAAAQHDAWASGVTKGLLEQCTVDQEHLNPKRRWWKFGRG